MAERRGELDVWLAPAQAVDDADLGIPVSQGTVLIAAFTVAADERMDNAAPPVFIFQANAGSDERDELIEGCDVRKIGRASCRERV